MNFSIGEKLERLRSTVEERLAKLEAAYKNIGNHIELKSTQTYMRYLVISKTTRKDAWTLYNLYLILRWLVCGCSSILKQIV